MRIGANDSDRCNWAGMGAAPAAPSGSPFTFNVTSGMVDQLCSFLGATGTKAVYGINFQSDQVAAAAAEAAYVYSKCGSSIIGIEIGNEINFFGTWTALKTQWETMATAILAAPGSTVIGPAASQGQFTAFTTPFAADESAKFGNKLGLVTQHYYFGGAGTTKATVANLQTVDPNLVTGVKALNTAVTTDKVAGGYRLAEANTFYSHGQMGVSDTLIASLWSIDMMYVTAENGGGGVNFHGGETGQDGTRPFYYQPIMEQNGVPTQVQPVYYGMLFFALAGAGTMVSTTVTTTDKYFTAYTVQANGGWTSVILDNKDATNGINATVDLGAAPKSASAILSAGDGRRRSDGAGYGRHPRRGLGLEVWRVESQSALHSDRDGEQGLGLRPARKRGARPCRSVVRRRRRRTGDRTCSRATCTGASPPYRASADREGRATSVYQ